MTVLECLREFESQHLAPKYRNIFKINFTKPYPYSDPLLLVRYFCRFQFQPTWIKLDDPLLITYESCQWLTVSYRIDVGLCGMPVRVIADWCALDVLTSKELIRSHDCWKADGHMYPLCSIDKHYWDDPELESFPFVKISKNRHEILISQERSRLKNSVTESFKFMSILIKSQLIKTLSWNSKLGIDPPWYDSFTLFFPCLNPVYTI